MKFSPSFSKMLVGALIAFASPLGYAIPTLQLGISGGTYNAATQTIVSTGPVFSLYAYLSPNSTNPLTDTYFLSMALSPQTSVGANLGSIIVNGNTINATSGMVYGTPPLESILGPSLADPGDLAGHGVFPTYFAELGFNFSAANTSGLFNTQDNPSWGPQSGTGMYYKQFNINTTNLANGYSIHFDLYNTALCGGKKCDGTQDIDITQFAPFSHDAESITSTSVPEPGTTLLLGIALLGIGLARRRAVVSK